MSNKPGTSPSENKAWKTAMRALGEAGSAGVIAGLLGKAEITIQAGGSSAAHLVQLDSAAFSLPEGATRVIVLAFISVQPTTAGEQVEYHIWIDGSPPSTDAVQSFGQTGTVTAQLSVNAALFTIITPGDSDPHVYSVTAQSAHNLQIGDKTAAIILIPIP